MQRLKSEPADWPTLHSACYLKVDGSSFPSSMQSRLFRVAGPKPPKSLATLKISLLGSQSANLLQPRPAVDSESGLWMPHVSPHASPAWRLPGIFYHHVSREFALPQIDWCGRSGRSRMGTPSRASLANVGKEKWPRVCDGDADVVRRSSQEACGTMHAALQVATSAIQASPKRLWDWHCFAATG